MLGIHQYMEQNHNMLRSQRTALYLHQMILHESSNLEAYFFIMQERVNVLASEQTKATTETAVNFIKLLNYCTTH
jgi:hypothetical protein